MSVLSLLHFNGSNGSTTITDEVSGNTWSAVGSGALTTSSPIAGSASLSVAGGTAGVQSSTSALLSALAFGTGDLTIELSTKGTTTPATFATPLIATSVWRVKLVNFGAQLSWEAGSFSCTLLDGNPHQLAVVRALGLAYLFCDGVLLGTASDANNYGAQSFIRIGTDGTDGYPGLIDEVRISNTALYTASYTPQSGEFPGFAPVVLPFAQQTAGAGGTATFSPGYTNTPTSYQWKKNGVDIGGATSSSYTTPALTAADNGAVYSVVATNSSGSSAAVGAYAFIRDIKQGYGDALNSAWMFRHGHKTSMGFMLLRKQIGITDSVGGAGKDIWGNWWWPAVAGGLKLTGIAATAAAGSLSPTVAVALTGAQATAAAGTVGVQVSVGLAGAAGTAAAGAPGVTVAPPLVGASGTGSAGAVGVQVGPSLTGSAAIGQAGAVAPVVAPSLTGASSTAAAGSPGLDVVVTLTGVSATAAAGTVTVQGGNSANLTGASATGQAGSVAPAVTVPLASAAASASPGTPVAAVSTGLTGVSGTAAAGDREEPRTIRETYLVPVLDRVLAARAPRIKPQRERAAKRAKVIEVTAARAAVDGSLGQVQLQRMALDWVAQFSVVPASAQDMAAVDLFMAQMAFRIRQLDLLAQNDDEEALMALLA